MNIPHQSINIDINSTVSTPLQLIANTNDSGSRYVDVNLYANGTELDLTGLYCKAVFVIDKILISDNVECTISQSSINTIVVPIENLKERSGTLYIQLTISDVNGESKLIQPIAFGVRITNAIENDAQINSKSLGSIAEIVKEVAAARGNYANLGERLSASDEALAEKANADNVYSVEEADDHFLSKHDAGITYAAKTELLDKANKAETYTKAEADTALGNKADKADTLAGYGITDAYTKDNIDKSLKGKLNAMPFDSVPSVNSPSYLTSGAVYNALLEKYDASNIETGSGSLTVYTPAAIESGLIASADFRYHKTGKLAQIFFNIVFNAGSLNYIQFTGLPFGADTMSNQNRVVIATDKHNQAAVYPVGSWLSLNFMGKNFSFAQGEVLKGVISIIIK